MGAHIDKKWKVIVFILGSFVGVRPLLHVNDSLPRRADGDISELHHWLL